MNQARARAAAEARFHFQQGERRANEAMREEMQKQLALEASATELERQFLQPSRSGVKLIPAGTNLYVRNYSPDPAQQPEALLAKSEPLPGLKGKHLVQGHPNPKVEQSNAEQPILTNTVTKDTSTGVFGRLIKPDAPR